MKKTTSLVITAALVLSQLPIAKVYASDLPKDEVKVLQSTSTNSTSSQLLEQYKKESELFGTTYEETKKPVPRSISAASNNIDEREEFKLDRGGLATIASLTPLTAANYEIVLSYPDKNTFVTSADTLQAAILKAKGLANSDPNAIPAVLEKQSGLIVYATEAMGRVVKFVGGQIYMPVDKNSNVYSSNLLTSAYTYVNHGYVDDVPILEDNGTSAKVEVAGYTGWMQKDTTKSEFDLAVVPLNKAANPSYYISENGELKHYISYDLVNAGGSLYGIKLGPAPSFMQSGVKYYSYDGNYFYTSLKTLISDGKAGHHNNAVNASNVYYNYYQFLPFRSKSTFTGDQINTYLNDRAGLATNSKLRGIGQYLVNGQNSNGVNALVTFGVACNESGLGTSSISQQKNNIFGINAVDSNPAGSANAFASVEDCINDFTKNYISRDYSDPDDWKHYGAYLGNKNLGANVKYASDPFWGEKAAQYMYKMDYHTSNYVVANAGDNASISNLKDFNNYQLAIFTNATDVLTASNSSATKLYTVTQAVKTGAGKVGNVIVVKSTDAFRDGTTSYYNITPDRSAIPWSDGGRFDGVFDWSKEAYVKADSVKLVNSPKSTTPPPVEVKKGWVLEDKIWYYYDTTTGVKKTGWLRDNNRWYYLDPTTGAMKTGWVTVDGKRYYLDDYGSMVTGLITLGSSTYYFNIYGAMETGLKTIDGKTYYFNADGTMAKGIATVGTKKYYFNSSGIMTTGWVLLNNNWYYFNNDGTMKTGWLYVNNSWYYLQDNGIMKTGWLLLGNTWYYLEGSGAMKTGLVTVNGYKYYLNIYGAMETGWILINGKWYYFYSGGDMAYNTTIGGYKLGKDGAMLP